LRPNGRADLRDEQAPGLPRETDGGHQRHGHLRVIKLRTRRPLDEFVETI
jgi:hypothetical protein